MFDELFIAPLRDFAFMRLGLAVVALVGVTSAVLSCLLVVRRQALLGDAIAHSVLLGVVLGWLVAQEAGVFWGALAAGVASGVLITAIERNSRIKFDAATGIVFTFLFALALAIVSMVKPRGVDLFHVLLGNVLGVGPEELLLTATSCTLVLAMVLLLFRPLQLWSFDPVLAQAQGLHTGLVHYLFTTLLSVTIVASIQAVGLVLVIAMLVTPGATAYLLSNRLVTMMAIAAAIGLTCATGGLYASYHLDVASGPAMVIAVGLSFFAALLFAPQRGVLRRWWAQRGRRRRALADDALRAIAIAVAEDGAALSFEQLQCRLGGRTRALRGALADLARQRLIEAAAAPALRATDEGQDKARDLVRAHRLIERWLHDVEQLPIDQLHWAATRIEHELDAEALRHMARQLGSPRADPHGHPIPAEHEALRRIAARPLADLFDGQAARVSMVRDDSDEALRDIARLGFLPEARVTMLAHGEQGLRVAIDGRETMVSPALADRVFVMPRPVPV